MEKNLRLTQDQKRKLLVKAGIVQSRAISYAKLYKTCKALKLRVYILTKENFYAELNLKWLNAGSGIGMSKITFILNSHNIIHVHLLT